MPIETITKDGRRRYRWTFKRNIAGQQFRKSKMLPAGTSAADADALARQWESELYAVATGTQKASVTIGECVRKHITDKHHTWKDSHSRVGILEKWRAEYEDRTTDELHAWSLEFSSYLRASKDHRGRPKRPLTDASIKNILSYIRAAIRYSHKVGLVDVDDTKRLVLPAVRNARHNYPQRREMLQIARKCRDRQVRAAIRIAFYSGMRREEILWATVGPRGFVLSKTKNGKPRVVPIHPRIAVLSRRIRFTINGFKFSNEWDRARTLAGYPGTKFHDLRHAAASEMINAGIDLFTVGGVLGHLSLVSTSRYSHLVTDKLGEAISRIGGRK